MPRRPRISTGGYVYHVLNRGVARLDIFEDDADFSAFEEVLAEALARMPGVRLLSYCLMSNHWHLVLWPRRDGELSEFMRWLTVTHTQRWHAHHQTSGTGPVYQGRYKSFLIERDEHLLTVCRYVERNAARADLVERAEDWQWSSLHRWKFGPPEDEEANLVLSPWPIPGGRPKQWLRTVNRPLSERALEAVRVCANRGRPYGSERWCERVVKKFGLASTMRGVGRPRNAE